MSMVPHPGANALTFGQTALRGDSIIPPRVKVVQAQSAEVATAGAKPGDLYNTLTGQNYGPTLRFIPIQPFMNRVLLVREERREKIDGLLAGANLPVLDIATTGLACRSLDMFQGRGEPGIECSVCPLAEWHGSEPPLCSETYNVAAMDELGDLLILSFAKSGAKTGKRFFSMLRLTRAAPWSSFYELTTHQDQLKGKGTFAVPDVKKLNERPADELFRWANEWAEKLGNIGPIDVTDAEAATEEGSEPF